MAIVGKGKSTHLFLKIGIKYFQDPCSYVNELQYCHNSDRDDLITLIKENMGTCTTKHAVIATLAIKMGMGIFKNIGIYAMSETLVTGTDKILVSYKLPYSPMCIVSWFMRNVGPTFPITNKRARTVRLMTSCTLNRLMH